MPWWRQLGYCYAATAGAFNLVYWPMWRHYMPGGKYDFTNNAEEA